MKKIEIDSKELSRALSVGGSMAGRNRSVPVYDYVKLAASPSGMRVVSFNGEVAVSARCAVLSCTEETAVCMDAESLSSYVRLVDGGTVSLCMDYDRMVCSVSHEGGSFELPFEDAGIFPSPAMDDDCVRAVMDARLLSQMLRSSQRFVAADLLRPVMAGMYIAFSGGSVEFCATDSHQLMTGSWEAVEMGGDASAIIPPTAFRPLLDILKDAESVTLRIGARNAVVSTGDASVNCRLVDGKYPAFRSVIPQSFGIRATGIGTAAVAAAAERCGLSNDTLRMDLAPGTGIVMSASGLQTGRGSRESVPCAADGELSIAFSAKRLVSALSAVRGDTFDLLLNSGDTAGVIRDPGDESVTILLMPMRLNNG